jgi:hypothetical protein
VDQAENCLKQRPTTAQAVLFGLDKFAAQVAKLKSVSLSIQLLQICKQVRYSIYRNFLTNHAPFS